MWPDRYQTPRYVWSTSAIATTLLHVGGIWWATTTWQSRQATLPPSPIQVIALPAPGAATPAPQPDPSVSRPDLPQTTPTAPTVPPAADPALPPTPQATSPAAPPSPLPAPDPAAPTAPPPSQPPASASPTPAPTPAPPPAEAPPNTQGGLQTTWAIGLVPDGSDLPDVPPQLPPGWEIILLEPEGSPCFTGTLPPLATARVTLQLTVETDGRVSALPIWQSSGNPTYDALIQCLVKHQLPPLIPAMTGGRPIPTDMALLTVEGRIWEP